MEDKFINEILNDIYKVDKKFMNHKQDLKKIVKKLIDSKPEVKLDEDFKLSLKKQLLEKAKDLKQAKVKGGRKRDRTWFSSLFNLKVLVPVSAVISLALFTFYSLNPGEKGFDLIPQGIEIPITQKPEKTPIEFELIAQNSEGPKISEKQTFLLKTSKSLSEKEVREIVKFEPAIDFEVKKKSGLFSVLPKAKAQTQAQAKSDFKAKAVYEIIPKQELTKDKVYNLTIKDKKKTDREYKWAFQVNAPFEITSTIPGNQKTSVPTDSMIEINFNEAISDDIKKYFAIEPKTKGKIEIKNDRFYFIPESLEEGRVYTVTVKAGYLNAKKTEDLDEDYSFSFETSSSNSSARKAFSISEKIVYAREDFNPIIEVEQYNDRVANDFEVKIYAFASEKEYLESIKNSQNWNLNWAYRTKERPIESYKPSSKNEVFSSELTSFNVGYDDYLEIPQKFKNGYYFVELERNGQKKGCFLTVSDAAYYYSISKENGFVWLYNFTDKQPYSNVETALIYENKLKEIGKTDQNGILKFELADLIEDKDDQTPKFLRFKLDNNQSFITYFNYTSRGEDYYFDEITTDRPLYHPTDTIKYWALLKHRSRNIQGQQFKIRLYDHFSYYQSHNSKASKEEPLLEDTKTLSDFNSFSGEFEIKGLDPGYYQLVIVDEEENVLSQKGVSIKTFTKPEYKISIEPSSQAVFAGEKMIFEIRASFFDGTFVKNTELKYRIKAYQLNDELEGTIKTDQEGKAIIEYTPSYQETRRDYQNEQVYVNYPVTANLTVEAINPVEGDIFSQFRVDVFGSQVNLKVEQEEIDQEKKGFRLNLSEIKLDQALVDQINQSGYFYNFKEKYEGAPVAGQKVEAEIIKITNHKEQVGEVYDFITKTTRPKYEYHQSEETIEEKSFRSDKNGQIYFEESFQFKEDIAYKIKFTGKDKQDRIFHENVYLFDQKTTDQLFRANLFFDNRSSSEKFSLEEEIGLNLEISKGRLLENSPVLYYRMQNKIEDIMINSKPAVKDRFQASYAPNVLYKAVMLTPYGVYETNSVIAKFQETDRELNIKITPDQAAYQPQEEVKLQLKVTDQKGQPVACELNLSIIDQAIYENNEYLFNDNVLENLYENIYLQAEIQYTNYVEFGSGAEGGGGGDGRESFMDTLFYTTVQTDKNGQAEVSFKLADNLTSWRITAKAFEPNQVMAGTSVKLIPSSLDFFITPTLGEYYLSSDKPIIQAGFFGDKFKAGQPVDYKIKSESLGLNLADTTNRNSLSLKLENLSLGEHEITFTAKQGGLEDKITRKIKVIDDYFSVPYAKAYRLSEDLTQIEGNQNGYTKLIFTDEAKALAYPFLNKNLFLPTLRSDQKTAAYLSKKLRLEYFEDQKEIKEMIDLSEFQSKNQDDDRQKGISLINYGDPDLEITAKIADAIAEDLYKEDLVDYFNSFFYNEKFSLSSVSKALYGLASLEEPVLLQVHEIKDEEKLTLEDKIYLALALAKLGDKEKAREYYKNEIQGQLVQKENQVYLKLNTQSLLAADQDQQIKLTALTAMLATELEVPESSMIVEYIYQNDPKDELDSLEEAIIARNLLNSIDLEHEQTFKVNINGEEKKYDLNETEKSVLILTLNEEELANLSFEDIKGEIDLVSVYPTSRRDKVNLKENGLIKREYYSNGQPTNQLSSSNIVEVKLTVDLNQLTDQGYEVIDFLPSGLKPLDTRLYLSQTRGSRQKKDLCSSVWFPDLINQNALYFNIYPQFFQKQGCNNIEITYYVRVISRGTYQANPALIHSNRDFENYYTSEEREVVIQD
jgi:hypothetical protein